MRALRTLLPSLALVFVALLALPALGQEEGDDDEGVTPISVVEEVPAVDPAVPVPPPPVVEIAQPWTIRFLVPATVVLAVAVVVATAVMYYVRVVRTRYRVVQ
ncbi:MAG: hypothetical protein R6X29_08220 [Acidimicrobiia bacterium]